MQIALKKPSSADIVLTRAKGVATANIRHRWKLHSTTGFEWGYGGSGPADLALNILLHVGITRADAERLHQDFKWELIAKIPPKGMTIKAEDVQAWVDEKNNPA